MMGSRGIYNAEQSDAFSRRTRRLLSWRPGEVKRIKRTFAKRDRRLARLMVLKRQDSDRA